MSNPLYRPKVYTASKIHHAPMWRLLRPSYPEINFTARWADFPDGPDHTSTFWTEEQKTLHWLQDIQDVQRSDYVLAYQEWHKDQNQLKGTLVEIGAAIGLGKFVLAVGFEPAHSWQAHPLVESFDSDLHEALAFILGKQPKP